VPYGFPPVNKEKRIYGYGAGAKLKLLFVGGLSQRKGIANLFAAIGPLAKHVELTVVGYKASENCKVLDKALAEHNWIPTLPHDKVLELMQQHDILVFPSLFEGFGLVMTEAMSQGTPVITTNRTAGPDIITHDLEGWLVEAGSTEALQAQIETLILNPKKVADAGKAAKESARKWTWDDYGQKLTKIIKLTL
jgi:glycosyltransferase involved in cell wall biosynthesis